MPTTRSGPWSSSAPAREELTGYRPEELVGNARLAYTDLVVPWHYEGVCRDIQAAIEKHNAWTTSYPIITASGERKWVWERGVAVLDESGRAIALEGLIVDMTSEREAEEALDLALAEWRQVFDSMDDSVMVLDGDGIVLRANAATSGPGGLEMDEIVGAQLLRGASAASAAGRRPTVLATGRCSRANAETSYTAGRAGCCASRSSRPRCWTAASTAASTWSATSEPACEGLDPGGRTAAT